MDNIAAANSSCISLTWSCVTLYTKDRIDCSVSAVNSSSKRCTPSLYMTVERSSELGPMRKVNDKSTSTNTEEPDTVGQGRGHKMVNEHNVWSNVKMIQQIACACSGELTIVRCRTVSDGSKVCDCGTGHSAIRIDSQHNIIVIECCILQ